MTKNWNYYRQVQAEIRFRIMKNVRTFDDVRVVELYHKANDLKRFWDKNKSISRTDLIRETSEAKREFNEKAAALLTTFASHEWTQTFIEVGTLWEDIKENRSTELEASKQMIVKSYIEARTR
jgi:head-tail adaptor